MAKKPAPKGFNKPKFLWRLLIVLGLGVAGLAILVGAIWIKPEFFVNLEWVRSFVVKRKLVENLQWKELELHTEMTSLFSKRVKLNGSAICVHLALGEAASSTTDISGCVDDLAVDVQLNLNPFHFKLEKIYDSKIVIANKFRIVSKTAAVPATPSPAAAPLNIRNLYVDNFALIDKHLFTDVPRIQIVVPDFEYQSSGPGNKKADEIEVAASLLLKSMGERGNQEWDLKVKAQGNVGENNLIAKINVEKAQPKQIDLKAVLEWQKNLAATLNIQLAPAHFSIAAKADGPVLPLKLSRPLAANLDLLPASFELRVGAGVRWTVVPKQVQIRNLDCKAQGNFFDQNQEFRFNVNCPIVFTNTMARGPLDLKIDNQIQLKSSVVLDDNAKLALRLNSDHKSKFFTIHLETDGEGKLFDPMSLVPSLSQSLGLNLDVADWNQWMKTLPLRYTVLPAPLNAMNGKLKIEVAKPLDAKGHKDVSVDLDFKGTQQALSFKSHKCCRAR